MTPLLFVLAAAVGAVGRLGISLVACSWQALLVANVVGSALLGALVSADLPTSTVTIIGVGFAGALTTLSSFALETRALGWRWGSAYVALTIGCCCAAASTAGMVV